MNAATKAIYDKVLEAMQSAEEMGGPDGEEYTNLMIEISKEAMKRHDTFLTQY